jgi:hypothetical protein
MTAILGLNAFHPDASACLVVDGKLVGAVAEERLGARRKHTMEFPQNAIRWVLQDAGLRLRDVTHVAIARNPGANLAAKTAHLLRNPSLALGAAARHLTRKKTMQASLGNLAEICGEDPQKVRYKLHAVEHHLAHIASAYYLSPFEALTAGFSYDGSGDFASAMAARCEGPRIDVLKRRRLPDSLGHFYTAMCQFIGFDRFGEEYKVMGLAPYGEDRFDAALSRLLGLDATRWFRLNPAYFDIARGFRDARFEVGGEMRLGRIYSDKLVDLLGSPRTRSQPIGQREMDIARSTQARYRHPGALDPPRDGRGKCSERGDERAHPARFPCRPDVSSGSRLRRWHRHRGRLSLLAHGDGARGAVRDDPRLLGPRISRLAHPPGDRGGGAEVSYLPQRGRAGCARRRLHRRGGRGGVVPGARGMGAARARQPLDPGQPGDRRHEGHHQPQDQEA